MESISAATAKLRQSIGGDVPEPEEGSLSYTQLRELGRCLKDGLPVPEETQGKWQLRPGCLSPPPPGT